MAGYKQPIKLASEIKNPEYHSVDLHAWVVLPDGNVLDYNNDDPHYKMTRKIHGLSGPMIRVPMKPDQKNIAFKKIFKTQIKPKIKFLASLKDREENKKWLKHIISKSGNCFMRAFILSKIYGSIDPSKCSSCPIDFAAIEEDPLVLLDKNVPCYGFQLGSAGWKNTESGEVWYEFG